MPAMEKTKANRTLELANKWTRWPRMLEIQMKNLKNSHQHFEDQKPMYRVTKQTIRKLL